MRQACPCGFALIEILVGLALGVGLVGAAATVLAGHLGEQRRQGAELSLHQALQSAVDLIARDLRRTGHRADAATLWVGESNPNTMVPPSGPASAIEYAYDAPDAIEAVQAAGSLGFRVDRSTRTLQMHLQGIDNWQPVTDPAVVGIQALRFDVESNERSLLDDCVVRECPPVTASTPAAPCGPSMTTRAVTVVLSGIDPNDPSVAETLTVRVSIRAGWPAGRCPA